MLAATMSTKDNFADRPYLDWIQTLESTGSSRACSLSELVSSSTRRTKDLFYAQDELVACAHVFGTDLVVAVDVEVPFAMIDDRAGTDGADLLAGVGQGEAVGTGVGELLQVVAVGADVDMLKDLIGGSGVEMDGLAGLCAGVAGGDGRRVVDGVPEIVGAHAGLDAFGGKERGHVVGIEGPGIVAHIDGSPGRVLAQGCVEVEVDALEDGHAEEAVFRPLEDEGGEGGIAKSVSDPVAAGIDVGVGEHDLGAIPGTEDARMGRDPGDMKEQGAAVHVGDSGKLLARAAEGFVVVLALADEFDHRSRVGDAIEKAGVTEVDGRQPLRLSTRAQKR